MRSIKWVILLWIFGSCQKNIRQTNSGVQQITGDDGRLEFVGRMDKTNPLQPRCWAPGCYMKVHFAGTWCTVTINDQVYYGRHNYITIVIDDGSPQRIKLSGRINVLQAAKDLADGDHTLLVCKDTDSEVGYIEFAGISCDRLLDPPAAGKHKIEFIGDSITAGADANDSIPCKSGEWYDQQDAYESFGPNTARALGADWQLTAVPGIGVTKSCCNMYIKMADVYDKTALFQDSLPWNFNLYQADAVVVCLGQNDGLPDSALFCDAYIKFIKQVLSVHPRSAIFCITSPMADYSHATKMGSYLHASLHALQQDGNKQLFGYYFSQRFFHGCSAHPNVAEHREIAAELTKFMRQQLYWN